MKFETAIKKNEILLFTGVWMKLDIIKISYPQKKEFHFFFMSRM